MCDSELISGRSGDQESPSHLNTILLLLKMLSAAVCINKCKHTDSLVKAASFNTITFWYCFIWKLLLFYEHCETFAVLQSVCLIFQSKTIHQFNPIILVTMHG